jgi:hypothetical protein
MADYAMLFSAAMPVRIEEEREWLEKYLQLLNGEKEHGALFDELKKDASEKGAIHDWEEIKRAWADEESGPEWEVKENDTDGVYFWFRSQEGFPNLEAFTSLVVIYMRKFDVKGAFYITWAEVCSRPILDAYGGGAVVVTKGGTSWFNTGAWVDKEARQRASAMIVNMSC